MLMCLSMCQRLNVHLQLYAYVSKYAPKIDLLHSGLILFYFKNASSLSCLVPCTSFLLFLFKEKNNLIDFN